MQDRLEVRFLKSLINIGAVIFVAMTTYYAFLILGWFGVFIAGVIGRLLTVRTELFQLAAVSEVDEGSTSIGSLVRQHKQIDTTDWRAKMLNKQAKLAKIPLYCRASTAWLLMITIGLGMFLMERGVSM